MSKVCTRVIIMGDEDFAVNSDVFQRLRNKIRLFAWIFHARCAIIFTGVDKYSSVRIAAIFADKKKVFDKRREGGVLSKTYYHYSRVPFGY